MATTTNNTPTDQTIVNTDIYNIADSLNRLARQYIPELTEDTLSVGLPGYIIALESMKMKNTAIVTGALSNEVFPSRAMLDKNIITHAIMQGVTGINATPSHMTVVLGILVSDFEKYSTHSSTNNTDTFIFDKYCPLPLSNEDGTVSYDFYIDYDIILNRSVSATGTYVYTAIYDLPTDTEQYNRISAIDNPYVKQPYVTRVGESDYIFLQTTIHQVSIERQYTTFITSNVVDNRTIVFEFNAEEQLADFEVRVTEPNSEDEIYLYPVFEGSALDSKINKYCEYTYINTNTIRINFVRTSYMPGLNAQVELVIKTTKGASGIFNYDQAVFIDYYSEDHGYPSGINILLRPNTSSTGGVDRKSTEELHNILPKQILMNGAITTDSDLTNYFNLVNTDNEKMIMMKKEDSQINRIYYAYMLVKNSDNNVVPTNTITLVIPDSVLQTVTEDGNLVLPAGSVIEYIDGKGKIVTDPSTITSPYAYMMLYTLMINLDPLYSAFFLTIINDDPYTIYRWINTEAAVQFMVEYVHFERSLIYDKNKYFLTFTATQNINAAENMYIVDDETGEVINNMKCFIVIYLNGVPYRYAEAEIENADLTYYKFDWKFTFLTDNMYDSDNKLKILGMYVAGSDDKLYGYIDENVEAYIYILAKSSVIGTTDRYDLDAIVADGSGVPVLADYGVTNKFEIHDGLNFFVDYSGILNCTITATQTEGQETSNTYTLTGVPVIGYDYVTDEVYGEERMLEFLRVMDEKKAYMDAALNLLENSFDIDYKFYNTYGPSRVYSVNQVTDSTDSLQSIGRIDIKMEFNLSLKSSSDIYTKDNIIAYVKNYIENLNKTNEDIDISNMMSDIRNEFASLINYIDYIGFNNFDSNTHHMYYNHPDYINIPPEFINIRTTIDEVTGEVIPYIVINVVG